MVPILVIIAVCMLKYLVTVLQSVMVSSAPFVKHYSCHRKLQNSVTVYGNSGSCRAGYVLNFVLTPDPMNPQPPAYQIFVPQHWGRYATCAAWARIFRQIDFNIAIHFSRISKYHQVDSVVTSVTKHVRYILIYSIFRLCFKPDTAISFNKVSEVSIIGNVVLIPELSEFLFRRILYTILYIINTKGEL
jgi:hypothetical protein